MFSEFLEILNQQQFLQMISIGLIFILIATGAYKKSITTTIYVTSISISLTCINTCSDEVSILPIIFGAMISLARAIILDREDHILNTH